MKSSESFEWNELKDLWENSSQTREIRIQVTDFLNEVKNKTSQFEKDAIDKDLESLKSSLKDFEGLVSQFEKEAINDDMEKITRAFRKFINFFNGRD